MECIKKKDASRKGLKRYFTGKPCVRGHLVERFTSNSNCLECDYKKSKDYRESNAESIRANKVEYNKKNKVEISISRRRYYDLNKDSIASSVSAYKSKNKCKVNALCAKRRAMKLNATPLWLSKEQMKDISVFYMVASWYGTSHHVDHIEPLMGEMVCGLHVPWNLQVIPATENLRKGNR